MGSGKGTAHASITCHLGCCNFVAGFRVKYGNGGTGMHWGAFSLRRKRTSPRPSPRASKCRAGLASDPGKVTWGKGRYQYASGQQTDSLPTCPWQRGLALFRPWWSVPHHLKKPPRFITFGSFHRLGRAACQSGETERSATTGAAGGGSTSGLGLTEMPIDRGAGLLGVEGALRGTNCRFESRICNEGEPALEPAPTDRAGAA